MRDLFIKRADLPVGPKGDQGPKGDTGEKGDPGQTGTPGLDGKDGRDGADGRDGKDGKDGQRGPRGEKGEPGEGSDRGFIGGFVPPMNGTDGQVLTWSTANRHEPIKWQDPTGGSSYTDEEARDAIGAALVEGAGIDIVVDDGADTITIASTITQYTDEMARDTLGTALTPGAGITITPSDPADTITIASTITQYTDEMAQDAIGNNLVNTATINFVYNDLAGTTSANVADGSINTTKLDDVSVSTAKIINKAVTYGKMQDISAVSTLLGTGSSSAGSPTEISVGSGLIMVATSLQSDKASTTDVLTGTDGVGAVSANSLAALWEKGSDIASAATISIGEGGYFHVTGTTTITDIDFGTDKSGRKVWLQFDGALTLTHNATSLILPNGTNIVTKAGGRGLFISEDGSNNVTCLYYGDGIVTDEYANQSEMEAISPTGRLIVVGNAHFHPAIAKFWVKATGNSTTIVVSYNMTSWADTAPGIAGGTIGVDFSSANWCGQVSMFGAAGNWDTINTSGCGFTAMAAGTFTVAASQMTEGGTAAANPLDPTAWLALGFGDL